MFLFLRRNRRKNFLQRTENPPGKPATASIKNNFLCNLEGILWKKTVEPLIAFYPAGNTRRVD